MSEAILLAKNGTRIVTRDELDHVDPPGGTATWFPLKHGHVLATVENTLNNGGFNVQSSQLALSNDGHRFFGTLTLGTNVHEGVALAVGVPTSTTRAATPSSRRRTAPRRSTPTSTR